MGQQESRFRIVFFALRLYYQVHTQTQTYKGDCPPPRVRCARASDFPPSGIELDH